MRVPSVHPESDGNRKTTPVRGVHPRHASISTQCQSRPDASKPSRTRLVENRCMRSLPGIGEIGDPAPGTRGKSLWRQLDHSGRRRASPIDVVRLHDPSRLAPWQLCCALRVDQPSAHGTQTIGGRWNVKSLDVTGTQLDRSVGGTSCGFRMMLSPGGGGGASRGRMSVMEGREGRKGRKECEG